MPRPAAIAAALGGALYFLGYVGYGVWPCLVVFLVPLWWALERVRGRTLASALAGGTFGLVAYTGGFVWLWYLVGPFLGGNHLVGAILWLGYGVAFALGFAAYGVLFMALRRRRWPVGVAAIAPLIVVEHLQLQIFPLYAGTGLLAFPGEPVWIQTADLGGSLLLSALVAGTNLVVFETMRWQRGQRESPRAVWATGLALAAAVLLYGYARIASLDAAVAAAPALRVGLVQANLSPLEKTTLSLVTHERHVAQTRELLAGGDVDLVVWPETAYVRGLRLPLPISGRPILGDLSVPLLFGASSVREESGQRRKGNAALLIGDDGMIRDMYQKNLLIPLAEYLPFAAAVPGVRRWLPQVDDFDAASDVPALHLGPWRIATPICYEAIRPDLVRRMVTATHPHLLVTLANDAWFGDSQEPWLHFALARLRAVEHRRYLVRATNSGVSAIVDPSGRVVTRTDVLTRANLRGIVHPLEGDTVYARFGDWPAWIAALVVAACLLMPPMREST